MLVLVSLWSDECVDVRVEPYGDGVWRDGECGDDSGECHADEGDWWLEAESDDANHADEAD